MEKQYSTAIDVRFSDFDLFSHVNSAVYFTYLETARIKLFRDVFHELTAKGIYIVVGKAECEYKLPIKLTDTVAVTLWVSRVGNASFDLSYKIHNNAEKVFALAKTTMVCFDTASNKTVAVPDQLKNLV
jgi:acyl-CoA thioester hydrolase